jgi:hypothetical protein
MLGHKLLLKVANNRTLSNLAVWLLNADATYTNAAGYVWLDGSAWTDANNFKGV